MDQPQMVPVFIPQQGPMDQQRERIELEVPARVRVAFNVVVFFSQKAAKTLYATSDMHFQELEGQQLEIEEQETRLAACKVLTSYLHGKLKRSQTEKEGYASYRRESKKKREIDGMEIRIMCPSCMSQAPAVRGCALCGGTGGLLARRENK